MLYQDNMHAFTHHIIGLIMWQIICKDKTVFPNYIHNQGLRLITYHQDFYYQILVNIATHNTQFDNVTGLINTYKMKI